MCVLGWRTVAVVTVIATPTIQATLATAQETPAAAEVLPWGFETLDAIGDGFWDE